MLKTSATSVAWPRILATWFSLAQPHLKYTAVQAMKNADLRADKLQGATTAATMSYTVL